MRVVNHYCIQAMQAVGSGEALKIEHEGKDFEEIFVDLERNVA